MEAELKRLELSLRQANKNWSDEQEEVLEPLERLRDLKRRHKKLTRSQSVGVGKGASNVKVREFRWTFHHDANPQLTGLDGQPQEDAIIQPFRDELPLQFQR